MMLGNRKRLYGCVVFGLALGMGVGFVYARAVKVTGLTPTATENADADGMVIVNYHGSPVDATVVQCLLNGFAAYTTYAVTVDGDDAPAGAGLFITTNASGNGSGHSQVPQADLTDGGSGCIDIVVWIEKDGFGGFNPNGPNGDDLRATGTNCP